MKPSRMLLGTIALVLLTVCNLALAEKHPPATLEDGLPLPYTAPKLQGLQTWINSSPLDLAKLKGKVVLVDFWTYSCVNCVRTLPHLTAWDQKYRQQGLVILGLHAPEFDFEKKPENVRQAVQEHQIHYPVALDNNMVTWSNFNNMYWPAHYLIDKTGKVVYEHFGEGEYEKTENNIRALLGLEALSGLYQPLPQSTFSLEAFLTQQTPETYLGYRRTQHFKSLEDLSPNRTLHYTFPKALPTHAWALNGKWQVGHENITSQEKAASLRLNFYAKKVFLVLGTRTPQPQKVTVLLNGQPIGKNAGKDVQNNQLTVSHHSLYELVNLDKAQRGMIELQTAGPGLEAYAFTFGG